MCVCVFSSSLSHVGGSKGGVAVWRLGQHFALWYSFGVIFVIKNCYKVCQVKTDGN